MSRKEKIITVIVIAAAVAMGAGLADSAPVVTYQHLFEDGFYLPFQDDNGKIVGVFIKAKVNKLEDGIIVDSIGRGRPLSEEEVELLNIDEGNLKKILAVFSAEVQKELEIKNDPQMKDVPIDPFVPTQEDIEDELNK